MDKIIKNVKQINTRIEPLKIIVNKSLCCNRNYPKKFDEKLKNRFANTYKFNNYGISKFISVLQKGPYEYINDWEKFNETSLSKKEAF